MPPGKNILAELLVFIFLIKPNFVPMTIVLAETKSWFSSCVSQLNGAKKSTWRNATELSTISRDVVAGDERIWWAVRNVLMMADKSKLSAKRKSRKDAIDIVIASDKLKPLAGADWFLEQALAK